MTSSEVWQLKAACLESDPELFFPEEGESTAPAKRICAQCPVRTQCLDYALAKREPYGVFGGLSEGERTRLLTRRTAAQKGHADVA